MGDATPVTVKHGQGVTLCSRVEAHCLGVGGTGIQRLCGAEGDARNDACLSLLFHWEKGWGSEEARLHKNALLLALLPLLGQPTSIWLGYYMTRAIALAGFAWQQGSAYARS